MSTATLTPEETFRYIEEAKNGNNESLDTLVRENMGLVKSIAKRFLDRGCDFEDLCQLGTIGMIKAIRNFDTGAGTMFSTYAVPLIMGEIKKFLRDDGMIKVGREIRRKGYFLLRQKEKYISEHGKEPTVKELAVICGMNDEEVVESLEATMSVMSFSEPVGDTSIEELLGADNTHEICENIALRQSIARLGEEERTLITYRYFKDLSQAKTGELMGISQVKVSRMERKIIEKLREAL